MLENTETQLKYVYRDNKPDLSFTLAVKKAQAGKYARLLTKKALRGSLYVYTRVYDDVNKTHYLDQMFGVTEVTEQVLAARQRNAQGMFVAS